MVCIKYTTVKRMNKETSIGAVVFRKEENKLKFLILKRMDNSIWEFPKGHLEGNETELSTLKRELNEELGIKHCKLIDNFREVISYISSRGLMREFIFYLVELSENIKKSKEHVEYKWITVEEASEYFKYDDMVHLLKMAKKILIKFNPTF